MSATGPPRRDQMLALGTAFLSLFSIVGVALYGLPFFYDFFVTDLGWTRQQVTSGNALSKLLVGPLFGFLAGVIVDRFGPRRLMLAGIAMAGLALVGLGGTTTISAFYFFYLFNALGIRLRRAAAEPGACSRASSTPAGARRWASPTSASASAACWCRSSRMS